MIGVMGIAYKANCPDGGDLGSFPDCASLCSLLVPVRRTILETCEYNAPGLIGSLSTVGRLSVSLVMSDW